MHVSLQQARKMLRVRCKPLARGRISGLLFQQGGRGEVRPQLRSAEKGQGVDGKEYDEENKKKPGAFDGFFNRRCLRSFYFRDNASD